MLEEMMAWQPPSGGSRPVPIGSQSIAVSLQPAIPRRVAPQQSPLPLHQSPTIVPQIPVRRGNQNARLNLTAGIQSRSPSSCPSPTGCHLYFARRVTFLSCADIRNIRVFESGGRVETNGFEHVDRAVAAGRRMIVFSGHIANWEIAMLAGVQYGISVAQIYRAGNNPLLDRLIARFRGDRGELIPKGPVAARRDRGVAPWHASDLAGRP